MIDGITVMAVMLVVNSALLIASALKLNELTKVIHRQRTVIDGLIERAVEAGIR